MAVVALMRISRMGEHMFFVTYLRRELRRRMRQAAFISLGLALGIGLVITVVAASGGVKKAQAAVLQGLYGVGTDVTVTGAAPGPPTAGTTPPKGAHTFQVSPGGAELCSNGKCENAAGQTVDNLGSQYSPIASSSVAAVARLHDVAAAAGGLQLNDTQITIAKNFGQPGSPLPQPKSFTVDGVDVGHSSLGPLSSGTITTGHTFSAADANADVAVVDSGYAKASNLKVGGTVTVDKVKFTVIGIVSQPQGSSQPDIYLPLARAQAIGTGPGGSLKNEVNTIYVTAASAADISAVQKEIAKLLPADTVTTASSLASQVTGSLSSTAKLANDLGKWLSVLVLIAAFAVASLLTMAAVSRRVREFGTLKALGWRSRRIVAQVMGESVALGIIGGAVGVGLGFAGAALITKIAPNLSATVPTATGEHLQTAGPSGTQSSNPTINHTLLVPMHASVTPGVIAAAVVLAVAGGMLAGIFGSWRIGQLRPARALARVE
jgi:putative ABC transport system permease protein